jgi:putative ATP-dependent endonuclease of the OLD family
VGAFDGVSLEFENYKSFGSERTGFKYIAPINLIIGRNNSGKSALLDMVEFACTLNQISPALYHQRAISKFVLTTLVSETAVRDVFPMGSSGGAFRGRHFDAARQLIGSQIEVALQPGKGKPMLERLYGTVDKSLLTVPERDIENLYKTLAGHTHNPFSGKLFYKLSADRDIALEQMQPKLSIGKNGQGFTSTVSQILNRIEHPTELVADGLLEAVNEVFSPDALFTAIDVQQHHENGPWEIFLNETGKGRVGLRSILRGP